MAPFEINGLNEDRAWALNFGMVQRHLTEYKSSCLTNERKDFNGRDSL